jgi:hypothetical protein
MATLEQKIEAEIRTRAIVEEGGLPQPDEVEYGYSCIRLLWHAARLAVVVQIDEPPPDWEFAERGGPLEAWRDRGGPPEAWHERGGPPESWRDRC